MAVLHHAEKCFIGPDYRAVESPHENPHYIGLDQAPALRFAAPQLLFSLFALVNIGVQCIPADDVAFGIMLREAAQVVPAINAVGATEAEFHVVRLACVNR